MASSTQERNIGNGCVIFDQFEVTAVDVEKGGGIIIPGHIRGGKGIAKDTAEGQKVIKQDTQVIYGRVKACGLDAHRGTYQPFPTDLQTWYPLPPGTYFTARKMPIWTNCDDELCIDTCYLIEFWFPCRHTNKTTGKTVEPSRPSWAPEE